ncbi:PEP-CTERM sorting domain-containing protein [Stieleria sp. JC731]|uniref:PEP-CTERM sorting domain-containing protein n=1 Tax=Pirellulaceae TaxID=2691357 RepID=UPI001E4B1E5F|nr:PEP-CTERM sorting domain-containing protein [Stieleria sp. JC731]MCC9602714.1 PEP-CTERM sorting domain-containing protein [Stieleria sp. JC731]
MPKPYQPGVFIPAFTVLVSLFLAADYSRAGIIDEFDSDRHARFLSDDSANPNFFLDHSQLSGVARQRAVLISPRHYVTANHIAGTSATFVGLDGVERTYLSTSSQRLTTYIPGLGSVGSDIRVHRIDSEVDAAIQPLPIVVGTAADLIGRELIAFEQHDWAGRNIIDNIGIVQFDTGSGDTVAMQFSYDTDSNSGSGGLGQDEIGLLTGDSGGTALMSINGTLGILGTHMGIDVPAGSSAAAGDRYDSFSTLLAPYEDQLSGILAADGYQLMTIQVTAIPEPSSAVLIGCVGCLIGLRRRRRPQS